MSTALRWRNKAGQFVKVPPLPSIALNSANVPGGLRYKLDAPVVVVGMEWTPEDARTTPIGAALAAERAKVQTC